MKNLYFSKNFLPLILLLFIVMQSYSQDMSSNGNSVAFNINDNSLEWGGCPDFMPEGCNIAVLHGDPSAENTDILFKVPANSDIPMHWHNSAERMVLISGEMEVTYEGEDTQKMKAGTYAYGPSRKPHTAKCKDSGPCVLFIGFIKPVDAFSGKPN